VIEHAILDSATDEWLAEMRAVEAEGEITPAQIRADFDRNGFCLAAPSGEPIGKVYSQYKHAALARDWLHSELRS
jgi:hypothetical protein